MAGWLTPRSLAVSTCFSLCFVMSSSAIMARTAGNTHFTATSQGTNIAIHFICNIQKGINKHYYNCNTQTKRWWVMKLAEDKKRILQFETGSLFKQEAEAVLDSLPVDISFIDKEDCVKYFSKAEGRIFVRTKAVIGRKVQLCHPQKSVHVVNKILEAFKTGKKDVAEFWISLNNRLILIRYFAVRNKNGKYLGTVEVTQDITGIKKIEGQKRLLDWKI